MKQIRKIAAFALAALGLWGCVLLSACGENVDPGETGERIAFSVTVLDPTGAPVEGLTVKWGNNATAYHTLENGKTTANLAKDGEYAVSLEGLLPIYKYTPVTVTADEPDKTIVLEWSPEDGMAVYTVKVVYPDGTPVQGVKLQLCAAAEVGGSCTQLKNVTDEKGETRSIWGTTEQDCFRGLPLGEYEAQVLYGLPEGYTYDGNENEDKHYTGEKATAEKTSITLVLKKG